jgi:ribosome-binding factor A
MGGKRTARLNEQFRREITGVLRTEVRDPRVGVPTVTGVEVTSDLWMARVYVRPDPSLPPGPEATEGLLEGLEAAAPFIRRSLGRTLPLRRIPEIRFVLDRTVEHAARIHALLAEVLPHGEEDANEAGGAGEPGEEGEDPGEGGPDEGAGEPGPDAVG